MSTSSSAPTISFHRSWKYTGSCQRRSKARYVGWRRIATTSSTEGARISSERIKAWVVSKFFVVQVNFDSVLNKSLQYLAKFVRSAHRKNDTTKFIHNRSAEFVPYDVCHNLKVSADNIHIIVSNGKLVPLFLRL